MMISNYVQRRLRHCERQSSGYIKSRVEAKQSKGSIFLQIASLYKLPLFKHSTMARNDEVHASLNKTTSFHVLLVLNSKNINIKK